MGLEAYIPSNFYKAEKTVVHILSDAEIKAFFEAVDRYDPAVNIIGFYRLAAEYKVLFQLIYCCCDKAPTVHCLRHTFVVKRMNLWMEEGIPLKEMLPFLSRYLGHQSPDETFYHYHQVAEAFRIIRAKDRTGKLVIPEVNTSSH